MALLRIFVLSWIEKGHLQQITNRMEELFQFTEL